MLVQIGELSRRYLPFKWLFTGNSVDFINAVCYEVLCMDNHFISTCGQ